MMLEMRLVLYTLCFVLTAYATPAILRCVMDILAKLRKAKAVGELAVNTTKLSRLRFSHRPETSHLDCARLFAGDQRYMKEVGRSRVKMIQNRELDMSCKAIRWRVVGSWGQRKTNYGIAFARIVYTDYEFLEEQLQVSYSTENHFCYHVDSKSSSDFKDKMKKLASCLPNVYLTDVHLDIDGGVGTNMNYAHLACMKLLEEKHPWNYLILQQNHDIMIRTNSELMRIFQVLNGSNDVKINKCPDGLCKHDVRLDAETLGVFNGSPFQLSASALKTPVFVATGAVQVSLARAAVHWINHINLTKLIERFDNASYARDEMLMSTLDIAQHWKMPGGFTDRCIKSGFEYLGITRMVHWEGKERSECKSGYFRHAVCVLGVEDLPSISSFPHILVNKMMPTFDYGAVACVSELLFNRTHLDNGNQTLDMSYYENLPVVRFNTVGNQTDIRELCRDSMQE